MIISKGDDIIMFYTDDMRYRIIKEVDDEDEEQNYYWIEFPLDFTEFKTNMRYDHYYPRFHYVSLGYGLSIDRFNQLIHEIPLKWRPACFNDYKCTCDMDKIIDSLIGFRDNYLSMMLFEINEKGT